MQIFLSEGRLCRSSVFEKDIFICDKTVPSMPMYAALILTIPLVENTCLAGSEGPAGYIQKQTAGSKQFNFD